MLKLVYHTTAFGPINLEYEKPVLRVGSSEDNDLVLLHPSVKPHHCLLSFWEENLAVLPPDASAAASQADVAGPEGIGAGGAGSVYGLGQELRIGELLFTLGHSINTVALPEALAPGQAPALALEESAPPATGPRYYCAQCGRYVPEAQLKRIGLVGYAKHLWCPQCSSPVEIQEVEEHVPFLLAWLRRLWQWLKKVYTTPPRPRTGPRHNH